MACEGVESTPSPVICYTVDSLDRIVAIAPGWDEFASANEGTEALRAECLGKSLWTFIRGPEVAKLYQLIMARVRSSQTPAEFPYRCDSPAMKRFLLMRLEPHADGSVTFTSRIEREEPKATLKLPAWQRPLPVPAFIMRCSVCNRFLLNQEWTDISTLLCGEAAIQEADSVRFVHTVCGQCYSDTIHTVQASIDRTRH